MSKEKLKLNKQYLYFRRWYKENEMSFHHTMLDQRQVSDAAFCEGIKYQKNIDKKRVEILQRKTKKLRNRISLYKEDEDYIKDLILCALDTDGGHHKQWYLGKILEVLDEERWHRRYNQGYDFGIAP